MSEADVEKHIAAAAKADEAKADSKIIGLHTSKDKKKVRPVFMGPKGGVFIITPGGHRTPVEATEYEEMEEAEVYERMAAWEAWLASSPTK